ncbi:hypothetical protein [Hwangdonia seohaensis]|uniref:Uncharacterized protein n=1 Tax=Hwangdonia seohaensis TaxID=1240727 RepID=A0ABW3RCH0_9FLAO|nr:hypothetical protein [Hwangdonia seohaensis]
MKNFIYMVSLTLFFFGCKQKAETKTVEPELSVAEKIAKAHGYENWKNVAEIQFTFNVDRDSSHFERRWSWNPKTNAVGMTMNNETVRYNRASVDSTSLKADQGFINDKFWLLVPFQLVWDAGTTISDPVKAQAPISKSDMNKITLTYSNDGGYTPGDAYDIYFDADYLIREWVFRKGNQKDPSMITTFENHQDFNGIKIALEHKKQGENWNLNFTDVKVTLE